VDLCYAAVDLPCSYIEHGVQARACGQWPEGMLVRLWAHVGPWSAQQRARGAPTLRQQACSVAALARVVCAKEGAGAV